MSKRIFVLIALLLVGAGFFVSYQNNQHAADQAKAVLAADAAGQDNKVQVDALKTYVSGHMGSHVDIMLSGAFSRAEAAVKAAAASQAANSQIYSQAQAACAGKSDSITQAKCNQDYLSKHLVDVAPPTPVVQPLAADYRIKASAPPWTADLAGGLFLAALAAGVWSIVMWRQARR